MRWWPRSLTPWKQRAITAERNNDILRKDFENMMGRYHEVLDKLLALQAKAHKRGGYAGKEQE